MQKLKPLATGLAFLFLALLLAGLAARFWASDKAYQFTGPTHIAAGQQHVYLYASGDVFQLSHAGELLSVNPAAVTGLNDDPIDLRVMSDGQLLIAEQQPAVIRLCDTESWICRPVGAAAGPLVKRQFKVLPGASPGELLLTDAQGDTLWKLTDAGDEPKKLLGDGVLAGPNGMVLDDSGHLWVADTDHRKILELLPSDDGKYLPGRQHSAMNSLTVGERFYPMMLARTQDGRLWVTQAAEFSKPHADLLVYDAEAGAQALVDLPDGAYPTDVVALQDSVLVTDLERVTVYRVSGATLKAGEFGNDQFRQRMREIRQQRAYYDRLGAVSLAVIVLFGALMITAAVRATPKDRRWTRPPAPFDFTGAAGQVPKTNGIHWLKRDPKTERMLKWLEQLGFIGFVILIIATLGLYVWIRIQAGPDPGEDMVSKVNQLGVIVLVSVLLGALIIPLIHYSARAMKRKLGTDGRRLYIRLTDGRELAVDPSQLAYSNKLILYRQYTLPLMSGKQQSLYAPGEVETWLAPLLHEATKLSDLQVFKHQWRNQQSLILWLLLLVVGMSLLLATTMILGG